MNPRPQGITGVTVIRNAVSLGYPFYYSVKSVMPACDRFIISDGYSNDGTDEIIDRLRREYPNEILVVQKEWRMSSSGQVIAEVTNDALKYCKTRWIYYIQADEIVHEANLEMIRRIPVKYGRYHSVTFPFLHFRPTINYILKNPSYHEAIRMFQNFRSKTRVVLTNILDNAPLIRMKMFQRATNWLKDIHSIGDGWTFGGNVHPILNLGNMPSVRPIFHVGYVCKNKDTLVKRMESHAHKIYAGMKGYQNSYEKAIEWNGSIDSFWNEVIPYDSSDYPKLMLEWIAKELS
jgi:hypothetical protein